MRPSCWGCRIGRSHQRAFAHGRSATRQQFRTLDAGGNTYLAYSRTSAGQTPESDALATNSGGTTLWNVTTHAQAPGSSSCASTDTPPCDERWGDYFGGSQDPSNPNVVWLVAAYQSSSGGSGWSTTISEANSTGVLM